VCRNQAEKQRASDYRRRKREQTWARANRSKTSGEDGTNLDDTLAAIELLEDELREVLVARVWGRLSLVEVARLCGISTTTAFRRYEAALKSLRARLDPLFEK